MTRAEARMQALKDARKYVRSLSAHEPMRADERVRVELELADWLLDEARA